MNREEIIAGSVMNVELLYQAAYEADALNQLRQDVRAAMESAP